MNWIAVYPRLMTPSGQVAATEQTLTCLQDDFGDKVVAIRITALNRDIGKWHSVYQVLLNWISCCLRLVRQKNVDAILIAHGLTWPAVIRYGLAQILSKARYPKAVFVGTIHGSDLRHMPREALLSKVLRRILQQCDLIITLGHRQERDLDDLGIPRDAIQRLPNHPAIDVPTDVSVREKWEASRRSRTMKVLHLSTLLDRKGFIEFVNALDILSAEDAGLSLSAVLCGPPGMSRHCDVFQSTSLKSEWIEDTISEINERSRQIHIRWIRGATGEAKTALFLDADVFVFPSSYPTEAQPLVVLEAMACGCAIVTSDIGEVPNMLTPADAVFLKNASATAVADAIRKLFDDRVTMSLIGRRARERYQRDFGSDTYARKLGTLRDRVLEMALE